MSSDSDPEHEAKAFVETVRQFPSYSAASVNSCNWVETGGVRVPVSRLELYTSRLAKSPAFGRVVGVGIRPKPTSKVVPIIRLDMDNTGKGIHFNATQLGDSNMKLAAVITPTAHFTEAKRTALYLDYIKGIEHRSAQFIWDWWRKGEAPGRRE